MRKPRPIEFMFKGYTAKDTYEILTLWDTLTDEEIAELGFNVDPPAQLSRFQLLH